MKPLDRLLYFLLALLLIAGCAGVVYAMIDPDYVELLLSNFIYNMKHLWYIKVVAGAAVLLVLILTLKVLFSRSGDGARGREPKQISISADGNVRITAAAVNEIVVQAAKEVADVRDAQCTLDQGEAGVNVLLTIYISGEQSIPNIAESTQQSIDDTMRNICGIIPANVRILVEKTPVATNNIAVTR